MDGHFEIAGIACHFGNFGARNEVDVLVRTHLAHLGRADAGSAVHGGECLIELKHAPAHRGQFLHEVDMVLGISHFEGGLHAGNPRAYDEHGRFIQNFLRYRFLSHSGTSSGDPKSTLGKTL